jgi:hypothetical protein
MVITLVVRFRDLGGERGKILNPLPFSPSPLTEPYCPMSDCRAKKGCRTDFPYTPPLDR